MTDTPTNPTDAAICGLLAAGPLSTRDLAARLVIPKRTVRHRLYRLRQAGTVVSGPDGLHRLAAPVPVAPIAGGLPALAAPATTASTAGALPPRAAPVPAAPSTGALPPRESTVTAAGTAGALPVGDTPAVHLAAPVMAPDHPDRDGPSPREGGRWGTGTFLAAGVVGLVVVGGIAIALAIHRVAPPSPPPPSPLPAPPMGFGYLGAPWGGMLW